MAPESPAPSEDEVRFAQLRLGNRLKDLREYLNFSQQYVADRTGIPRSAISDIERGSRKVDSLELEKLARLYSYPMAFFLDADDDAEVGTHAIKAMARALSPLGPTEREEVLRFAEFLRQHRLGRLEAAEAEAKEGP